VAKSGAQIIVRCLKAFEFKKWGSSLAAYSNRSLRLCPLAAILQVADRPSHTLNVLTSVKLDNCPRSRKEVRPPASWPVTLTHTLAKDQGQRSIGSKDIE